MKDSLLLDCYHRNLTYTWYGLRSIYPAVCIAIPGADVTADGVWLNVSIATPPLGPPAAGSGLGIAVGATDITKSSKSTYDCK